MTTKYQMISMLAEETAKQIARNGQEWMKYLDTAARLYKYPFNEQMLIYAQRPDASACASLETWNEKMNCWVNRGAKGIALIDTDSERPRLKYVFDVSDVHKARRIGRDPYLWELREEHKDVVLARLENIYGETDAQMPFEKRLIELAERIASDYYEELLPEIGYVREGSFLEELDELNVGIRLRDTLASSIAYTILSRCGADMEQWKEELDFDNISEFNTTKTLSVLGSATTEMCKPLLMEIGNTIRAYDRQTARKRAEEKAALEQSGTILKNAENLDEIPLANTAEADYNALKRESETQIQNETETTDHKETEGIANETDIREERGLSDPEPDAERGAGTGTHEVRADEKEILAGTPERDLSGHGADGRAESTLPSDTGAGRAENGLPDTADGKSRGSGRGTESSRSDEMGGTDEQHQTFSGGNRADGADLQLENSTQQNKEQQEPDSENNSLSGSFLDNDQAVPNEDVTGLRKGILCSDEFLIHKRPEIAGYFAMEQDTRLQTEYFRNCFPFGTYYALDVAGTSVGFHAGEEGLYINMTGKAGAENETLLSWEDARFLVNSYMEDGVYLLPGEVAEQIDMDGMYKQLDLFTMFSEQVGNIAMKQAEEVSKVPPAMPIPQEQLDAILRSGGGRDNSRKRIYAKYCQGKTPEEMAEFLKKEYGTTGKGFEFDGKQTAVWFDEQGMTAGYGTSALENPRFTMSWKELETQIRSQVENGTYMSANEVYLVDEAERGRIANHLYFFFRDGMEEMPEELELKAANYPDSHAGLVELLSTPEGVDMAASYMDKALHQLEMGEKKLRFRSVMPKEELRDELDNLLLKKKTFPADDRVEVKKEDFITQDEIDHRLGRGSGYHHGSFRIYDYFMEGHNSKDAADFLKHEYGIGGSSHALAGADHSWEDHDSKGISLKKGNLSEPYSEVLLSWKVVEKRIRKLIQEDKYLSPKGKEAFAAYKEEQAQKELEKAQEKIERDTKAACKDAIDRAITENFDGYRLPKETAEGVIKEYGIERVSYVLANTVMHRRQEDRISPENKEWAKSITPYAMYESRDIVAASHPAVLNGFINQARRYIEHEKEIAVQAEAEQVQEPEQNDVLDISEGELEWHIIHEGDDENGQPTEWSAKLPDGEFLWIDKEAEGYALYNTHHTDASPVTVSETLDGAKESGEDYALEFAAVDVEEVEKTTVALESSEDYSEPGIGFYTHQYADGRDGVRYRLVTQGEDGLLVPYPEHNRFFINRGLAQEYIDTHADLIDVIGYDEMVFSSMQKQGEYKREHDDGEGFTIHTEKNDIWERMPEPELSRLEGILGREALYYQLHNKIAGAESLEELKEIEFDIMENQSPYFSAVSGRVWEDFNRKNDELSGVSHEVPETSGQNVQKSEPDTLGHNVQKQEPKTDRQNAVNFHITDDALGIGSAKEKFRRNVEAIRTLEKIESENRTATPEEQEILSQYVGWGGLADAFDETKANWHNEYQELKGILSDAEYASARESTLNAHYTREQAEKEVEVTLMVSECSEFHNYGEFYENISTVEEAIAIWKQIPPERLNAIPAIGINVHLPGTEPYEDSEIDILSGRRIDLEILEHIPDIKNNPKAMEVIAQLVAKLPEMEIDGVMSEEMEARVWELRMPGLDKAGQLAVELDRFVYDYDIYSYRNDVHSMTENIAELTEMLNQGDTEHITEWLNEAISEGAAPEEEERAKELLEKLAEYTPLAKIEENAINGMEEQNYNMVDDVQGTGDSSFNNGVGEKAQKEAAKREQEQPAARISLKARLAEKKAQVAGQNQDHDAQENSKNNQREM